MKFIVNIFIYFFSLFSDNFSLKIAHFFSFILERIIHFRQKIIEENLSIAFAKNMTPKELKELRHQVYKHLGILLVEILRLPSKSQANIKTSAVIHNQEIIDKVLKEENTGVFLLSGHLGNWEQAGRAIQANGIFLKPIVKEIKSEIGCFFVKKMRTDKGIETIPRKNAVKKIISSVKKEKKSILFMLDQNMTSDEGIFVDFFNKSACTMNGLAVLVAKGKYPVIPVSIYRDKDELTHHITFLPPLKWEDKDDKSETILRNTQNYTKIIEDMIRKHPAQWLWIHKRWKTKPETTTFNKC